jgi:hypothetical protein
METTIFRALMMYGIAFIIAFFVAFLIKGMFLLIMFFKKPDKPQASDDVDQLGIG